MLNYASANEGLQTVRPAKYIHATFLQMQVSKTQIAPAGLVEGGYSKTTDHGFPS